MAKPITDTGWQKPQIVEGVGGVITPPSAVEAKPCWLCKSWEKDTRKLDEYVRAHGMKMQEDGCYVLEEYRRGIPTRQQFRLDPKKTGWCRRDMDLAMDEFTCPRWEARVTKEDLRGIIR
jgi:hypothetical protein